MISICSGTGGSTRRAECHVYKGKGKRGDESTERGNVHDEE